MIQIRNVWNKVKNEIAPFRTALIFLGISAVVCIVFCIIVPGINKMKTSLSPIVSIEAENNKTYTVSDEIKISDFTVTAIHENGSKNTISGDSISLSENRILPVGESFTTTVYLADDESIACDVTVAVTRNKVIGFQCGYPNVKDVVAVLYSNGELCFEGTGDVLVFNEGNYPWLNYEESKNYPIRSVTFEDGVTPVNMNYWFQNIKTLEYAGPIPESVKSMVRTFSGCTALTKTADWSNAASLLNINQTYQGCVLLTEISPVPEKVRTAGGTFSGCSELQYAADTSASVSLTNAPSMYENCPKLIYGEIGPSVTNMENMFYGCINLRTMPEIPGTVTNMANAFYGNSALARMSPVPASVKNTEYCFYNCEMLSGEIIIDANPESFSGMFTGASVATQINLTGRSLLLDAMANTSDSGNAFVNGGRPNADIRNYNDVFQNR